MIKTTVKILIDPDKNSLTFSKNFRIFSTQEPVGKISSFTDFIEDFTISSPAAVDLNYLRRYFRYSRNRLDWSLWYEVEPNNLGEADDIQLEPSESYYFEVKYEYDNGSLEELESPILINEVKLRFRTQEQIANTYSPVSFCSDERCISIITNQNPSFRPYNVNSAVGMFYDISYFTNQIYGHEVVYFRTLPEANSGDYIFKEWTLYKNVDRKCIKIMVPKNAFPANNPKYSDFGIDFQFPFEIHVDHRYFQSVFGRSSEPRKRDFLYFPLINRMFEIQGSYLNRGFMMAPIFWKVSLKKYNPNIDMLLKDESRTFLDNVITNAEQLFEEEVDIAIKDSTMPQQYKTISTTFDQSRKAIHPEVSIRPLKYTFNFASLIENYYDLGRIQPAESSYQIVSSSPLENTAVTLENLPSLDDKVIQSNSVIIAYQGSDVYIAWRNNGLLTNDLNVLGSTSLFCRVRGPFDSIPNHIGQSPEGRYIRVEAYRDLQYKSQRDILTQTIGGEEYVKFKNREAAVVYNALPRFGPKTIKNISYTALFNVNPATGALYFINGFDNATQTGLRIEGHFTKYFSSEPEGDLIVRVYLNSQLKTYTIPNFKSGEWHAIVVSISNEFKQCGFYIYSIIEDSRDLINHNEFRLVFTNSSSILEAEFEHDNNYYLPASGASMANIRLFNTMIREEQHDFILSQQYIKDESMLILIDNCKPQINLPYIAKNR